jgi:hypothetical protein
MYDYPDFTEGKPNTNFIDIPVVIESISFNESKGSPCPLAKITFFNRWRKSLQLSGVMEAEIVIHRYVSPEKLTEKHIELFSKWEEKERLFYKKEIKGDVYKVFPFRENITVN